MALVALVARAAHAGDGVPGSLGALLVVPTVHGRVHARSARAVLVVPGGAGGGGGVRAVLGGHAWIWSVGWEMDRGDGHCLLVLEPVLELEVLWPILKVG